MTGEKLRGRGDRPRNVETKLDRLPVAPAPEVPGGRDAVR
jgi:hypothetical protein